MEELIQKNEIHIISGEGDYGTRERYDGKRTLRAIKIRLTRERCNGDRWARAEVYSHESKDGGLVGIDIESGDYCTWHELDD